MGVSITVASAGSAVAKILQQFHAFTRRFR
jgi:hypothetical protein